MDGTVLHLAAQDKAQMACWIITIDGTKHAFTFSSSVDFEEKVSLMLLGLLNCLLIVNGSHLW
jgi:hypothetical protein